MVDDGQTDIRTDADRQSEGPMASGELAQLKQIVENGPVWAGDLISKHDRTVLVMRGFVVYQIGDGKSGGADAKRLGGYVPTQDGIAAYQEENLHVNLSGAVA